MYALKQSIASPPKAVLFDWDNTLVDTWPIVHDALNHTLVTFGLKPYTLEEFRNRPQTSHRQTFPLIFGDQWAQAEKIYYSLYAGIHKKMLKILPGAQEILEFLYENGVYLAVVSNKNGPFLRREVEYLGWKDYFKCVVGSTDSAHDKPSIWPVRCALKESGIEPGHNVWLVGDSDIDVECALNSKCVPVVVGSHPLQKDYGDTVLHAKDFHTLINILGTKNPGIVK